MVTNKFNPTILVGGLVKDYSSFNQPPNTYPFALNTTNDSTEGNMQSIVNEKGTLHLFDFNPDEILIGHINISDEDTILFSTDGVNISRIGLLSNDTYTQLVSATCLSFSKQAEYRVRGEHRVINGCDRIIYFNDGLNPDRRINLDRLSLGIYNTAGTFDCNKIELNPNYTIPQMTTKAISSGSLKEGSYEFAIAYLDTEFNTIYRSYTTLPTYVIKGEHGGVQVDFNSIDTGFPYLNIYCVRAINKDGVSNEVFCVKKYMPIQNDAFSFVLTNITSEDTRTTLDELTQKTIVYESSKTMEQVDGRLIRANLREKYRDYKTYQSFASSIDVYWVSKWVNSEERHQTFMGGEVYPFGIVYIHNDGSESPVFHIPCRTNYALLGSDPNPAYVNYGTCASYNPNPSSATYVNPLCADTYWGNLNGQDISHFIMPDRDKELMAGILGGITPIKRVLGFKFENVTYPPNVVGHYIVKGKRDESNKRIKSKGYAGFTYEHSTSTQNFRGFTYYTSLQLSGNRMWYVSPEVLYNRKKAEGNSLDFLFEIGYTETNISSGACNEGTSIAGKGSLNCRRFDGAGSTFFGSDIDTSISISYYEAGTIVRNLTTVEVDKTKYFNPMSNSSLYDDGFKTYNTNQLAPVQLVQLGATFDFLATRRLAYGAFVNTGEILGDLHNITYVRTHNGMLTGNTVTFQGDVWLGRMVFQSLLLHKEASGGAMDVFTRILGSAAIGMVSAIGVELATGTSQSSNTDLIKASLDSTASSAISKSGTASPLLGAALGAAYGTLTQGIKEIARAMKDDAMSDFTQLSTNLSKTLTHLECCHAALSNPELQYHGEMFTNFYVESEIDVELREIETSCGEIYNTRDINYVEYCRDRLLSFDPEAGAGQGRYVHNTIACPELYSYNYDYSRKATINTYYPLEFTYDYCSSCIAEYPNRIIYSAVSPDLNISQGDTYSAYLANSVVEIPAHRGEITRIEYINNSLLVQTTDSSYIMQTNPNRLTTDASTVYVDTGDFLSITPYELSNTDVGYAGNQSGEGVSTPLGFIWIDTKNNTSVYLYNGQLQELSKIGLYHFFRNLHSDSDYQKINITYDPLFDRVLLGYKQYQPYKVGFQNQPYSSVEYWKNHSFTLSYCLKSSTWTSFHSYLPEYMFHTALTYYAEQDSALYKHNFGEYLMYYGTRYPQIIEWVYSSPITTDFNSIVLYSNAYDVTGKLINQTYNKGIVYTDNQSSGEFSIISTTPNSLLNLNWDNTSKTAMFTDQNIKISGIRDLSSDNIVMTSDWNNISSNYFIDKVPVNINYIQPLWLLKKIHSKSTNIRLSFLPVDDVKLVTNFIATTNSNSIR